jgi:hypothetical protein
MSALVGMDHCGYLLSDFAGYFNRDVPTMSKQVKNIRLHLEKNRLLKEKMTSIQDQITTIRKA